MPSDYAALSAVIRRLARAIDLLDSAALTIGLLLVVEWILSGLRGGSD